MKAHRANSAPSKYIDVVTRAECNEALVHLHVTLTMYTARMFWWIDALTEQKYYCEERAA